MSGAEGDYYVFTGHPEGYYQDLLGPMSRAEAAKAFANDPRYGDKIIRGVDVTSELS